MEIIFSTQTFAERAPNFSLLYLSKGPVGIATLPPGPDSAIREFEQLSIVLVRFLPISTVTGAVINKR